MKFRSIVSIFCIVLIAAIAMVFSSCTPMITQEQLAQLKELRTNERSLQEQIKNKNNEKARVESELNARKAELKKCQDDKTFVTEKLTNWPNVWPDWDPNPPAPEPEVLPKGKKKVK